MANRNCLVIATLSDNVVEVPALTNGLSGDIIASATVFATLSDDSGNEIPGVAWPITMAEDGLVPGRYLGTIPHTAQIPSGSWLLLVISADAGDGLRRTWTLPVWAP